MSREAEQVGKEEEVTHRSPMERDKERIQAKRRVLPLKAKGEKWITAGTLGKFIAENHTIAGKKGKEGYNGFPPYFP